MKFFGFTPPDMILIFVIIEILSHYIMPVKIIILPTVSYLGIPLIILGIILSHIWSPKKKAGTTSDIWGMPTKLITTGPYKFSRNPTYLGMALTLIGIAILLGSIITFVFPIIFIITTNIFVIPIEEKNLKKAFGKKYEEYKKTVKKWI